MAAGTVARAIMLAWQLQWAPTVLAGLGDAVGTRVRGGAAGAVHHADLPHAAPADPRRARRRAPLPRSPPRCSRSSARGPWAGSTTDWVATAPTPGHAQVQSEPTENQCDWTAAPSSPVAGSRATIE